MNKAILVGKLAADPQLKTSSNGVSYVSFRIACQRRYANQQGVREADFISCCAWRQTAEFIHRYFPKGSGIAVEGSIQTRSYDAQDGSRRYVTEVLVENAEFVTPRGDSRHEVPPQGGGQPDSPQPGGRPAPPGRPEQTPMDVGGFTELEDDGELPF